MVNVKDQFPILSDPQLIYLDNAATTQKPSQVIDALVNYYKTTNANVHRGLYPLSENATDSYEKARASIAKFINADSEEVIFTSGTTDSINKLSQALYKGKTLKVLASEDLHHSALLPWQSEHYDLQYIKLTSQYELDYQDLAEQLKTTQYEVLILSHISNVTGAVLDFAQLKAILPSPRPIIILDAAQSLAHLPINVHELPIDFLAASAHKAYGPTGVGILWGRKDLLSELPPFNLGGGMIRTVERQSATWADIPERFEAGTPPIAEAITMAAGVDFITQVGWEQIQSHEEELRLYAVNKLREIAELTLYCPPTQHKSVISFTAKKIHAHDLAQLLGDPTFGIGKQICTRAGHHCTQILHREVFGVAATTRISLGIYNQFEDIDDLVAKLKQVITFFNHV